MAGILIAGSGGQGILFAGKLLAEGAMLEGKHVTWFPSYGAEMRGGTANCTVVVSDEPIGSPIVKNPDIVVVFNEASLKRFEGRVKKGGLLLMDSTLVKASPGRNDMRVVEIPATGIAMSLGSVRSANMVLIGALLKETSLLKEDTVMRALKELTPARRLKSLDINKAALGKGLHG